MDFQQKGVYINLDQFWPVEHPTEPLEEDQPVKYPIPNTSPVKDNDQAKEEQFSCETLRRKAKFLEVIIDQKGMVGGGRPRRAVRRRHQIQNHKEKTAATSLLTVSPGYPFQQSNSMKIFQKSNQFNY